jgi:di/tricarboxylate transporter
MAMQQRTGSPRHPFFLRLILTMILLAAVYQLLRSLLCIANIHQFDEYLRIYPKNYGLLYELLLLTGAIVVIVGWNNLRRKKRNGIWMYMTGKILLASGEIYGIITWSQEAGKAFPWETILVYAGMWAVCPIFIWIYKPFLFHGNRPKQ